ncbi:cobalamin biosynthesis protein CobW [Synergistales bacterium]|nr:cobalamin biosynthesis protein CobW [Synergistales bacterium]
MVSIDIVSGFLGAGKTTLIKKLLPCYPDSNTVIIENEFGDIGIDGDIIEREGYRMVEISSGCICCIMKDDFLLALDNVVKDLRPEHIVIEPTGISILSDIVKMLKKEPFQSSCVIHALITVVDCENFIEQRELFGEFFKDQISNATHLLLSKAQNVGASVVEDIVLSVRQWNDKAPVVAKNWDEMSIEEALSLVQGDTVLDYERDMPSPNRRSCREKRFSTFAVELPSSVSRDWLEANLSDMKEGAYGAALRGKGFVRCGDEAYAFSFTNNSYRIDPVDYEVSGKLCFIGIDFDEEKLKALWTARKTGVSN